MEIRLIDAAPHILNRSGAISGENHLREFRAGWLSCSTALITEDFVDLNFRGIESATPSYIKATLLQTLLDMGTVPAGTHGTVGEPPFPLFPVVSGLNEELRDAINEVLFSRRLGCLEVLEWGKEKNGLSIVRAFLCGTRDKFVLETLQILQDNGRASAAQLQSASGGQISVTGWSNRLYDVFRLRLARRTRADRSWLYEPLAHHLEW